MTSDLGAIKSDPRFQGPFAWEITPELYDRIRDAWLTHVDAEEKLFVPFTDAEFDQNIAIMLSVLTDDCVFSIEQTGERFQGHDQARQFYRIFLTSLSGMQWVPQAIVIGPQGVLDVVNMTGRLEKPFAGYDQVGQLLHLQWVIYFPWVPDQGKFGGEIVYQIRPVGS